MTVTEEQTDQGYDEEKEDEIPDYPFRGYNPYLSTEYQMMLNKMMIEQMKMLRQQMKYSRRKQDKLKGKSQRIYDLLAEAVKEPEPEPIPVPEPEPEEENEENSEPEPEPEQELEQEPVQPQVQYQQDYERKIDELGGFVMMPSRRDRLNFKNFNI